MNKQIRSKSVGKRDKSIPNQISVEDQNRILQTDGYEEVLPQLKTKQTTQAKKSLKLIKNHMKKNKIVVPRIPNTLPDVKPINLPLPNDYSNLVDYSSSKRLMRRSGKRSQKNLNHSYAHEELYESSGRLLATNGESHSPKRDISPLHDKVSKKMYENNHLNDLIDEQVLLKRGLRSLKYRHKAFDPAYLDSLNGGELLNEIIENKMQGKEFKVVLQMLTQALDREIFKKKVQTTVIDALMTFLSLKNVSLCSNIDKNLGLTTQYLSQMINAEKILVYLYDKSKNQLYLKVANYQLRENISIQSDEGLIARPFNSGNIVIAENINYDEYPSDYKRYKKILKGMPSNAAFFPLKFGDGMLGLVEVLNFNESIDKYLRLITLFCDSIASGLMLYDVKRSHDKQTSMVQNESNPFAEVQKTINKLQKLTQSDAAALYVKNNINDELIMRASVNLPANFNPAPILLDRSESPISKAFSLKKCIVANDTKEEYQMDITKLMKSVESLYMPLTNETNLQQYGVIQLLYKDQTKNLEREQMCGENIASILANKIQDQSKIQKMNDVTDLLDFAVNQCNELVLGLDSKYNIVYCNKAVEETLKRGLVDVKGKSLVDVFGDSNLLIVSFIMSALDSHKDTIYQNLQLQLKWSEHSTEDDHFSTPKPPMPVNLKVLKTHANLAKFMIIIQPIILIPEVNNTLSPRTSARNSPLMGSKRYMRSSSGAHSPIRDFRSGEGSIILKKASTGITNDQN